jgi:hypothetical protein
VEKVLIKLEHALPRRTSAVWPSPPPWWRIPPKLEKILQNPDDPEQEARFQILLAEGEELEKSMRLKENDLLEGMEPGRPSPQTLPGGRFRGGWI